MKLWVTEIKAIDPHSGDLKTWCGPNVPGINYNDAVNYCQTNELGYCKVLGELIAEIPCIPGSYKADFSKIIDYTLPQNN